MRASPSPWPRARRWPPPLDYRRPGMRGRRPRSAAPRAGGRSSPGPGATAQRCPAAAPGVVMEEARGGGRLVDGSNREWHALQAQQATLQCLMASMCIASSPCSVAYRKHTPYHEAAAAGCSELRQHRRGEQHLAQHAAASHAAQRGRGIQLPLMRFASFPHSCRNWAGVHKTINCATESAWHLSARLMERSAVDSGSSRRDRPVQPVRSRLVHLAREGAAASRPGRGAGGQQTAQISGNQLRCRPAEQPALRLMRSCADLGLPPGYPPAHPRHPAGGSQRSWPPAAPRSAARWPPGSGSCS